MWDNASPADILAFLNRIDSTVLPNRTTRDAWIEFLKKNGGGSTASLNDLESNWMNSRGSGGSNTGKHKSDQVDNYLTTKGFSGSRKDKIRAYLQGSATQ